MNLLQGHHLYTGTSQGGGAATGTSHWYPLQPVPPSLVLSSELSQQRKSYIVFTYVLSGPQFHQLANCTHVWEFHRYWAGLAWSSCLQQLPWVMVLSMISSQVVHLLCWCWLTHFGDHKVFFPFWVPRTTSPSKDSYNFWLPVPARASGNWWPGCIESRFRPV